MTPVTDAQVAEFTERGFVVVDDVIDAAEVAAVCDASDRVQRGECTHDRRPPGLRKPLTRFGSDDSIRWYLNARMVDGELWRATTSAALGATAARLLRSPTLSIVEDQLLDKPGPGLPCNFHQDYGYWLFSSSTQMISCWIALVDLTPDMGPLQMIPGSHRWGHRSNPRELIVGSEAGWREAVDAAHPPGAATAAETICLRAGSGVFFHSLTFHGSGRNTTDRRRRAFSIHWAGDECRVDRAKLSGYTFPYIFAGVQHGSRVQNKYMPVVYPGSDPS